MFYTNISNYYDYIFPLNNDKIEFILKDIVDKQNILDLGCSTGLLAKTLSESGHLVKGIDLDEKMISLAKQYENESLKYYVINMLDIDKYFSNDEFDQIICFGNTIVHLINRSDICDLFKKIRNLLKNKGQFKFQIINYDKILNENLKGLPTIENDKIKFIRRYKFKNGFIEFSTKLFIKEENKIINNTIKLLPIRKEEILDLLRRAGFNKVDCYSSFVTDAYDVSKFPLIVKAQII